LSLSLILINSQIRYLLLILPILILNLGPKLKKSEFKKQLGIFIVLSIIVVAPYLIQIKYSSNAEEFTSLIENFKNIEIEENIDSIIVEDLESISSDFKGEVFVVGDDIDGYRRFALLYWGKNVKEFVSIQDYEIELNGDYDLFSKIIEPNSNIENRRIIWIGGGIKKNPMDSTNYNSIKYGISTEGDFTLEGFEFKKKYKLLSLYEKKKV
jgi:hypothetical protein